MGKEPSQYLYVPPTLHHAPCRSLQEKAEELASPCSEWPQTYRSGPHQTPHTQYRESNLPCEKQDVQVGNENSFSSNRLHSTPVATYPRYSILRKISVVMIRHVASSTLTCKSPVTRPMLVAPNLRPKSRNF